MAGRARTPRRGGRALLPGVALVAGVEGLVDLLHEGPGLGGIDQPPDQQRPVAQDRRAEDLRRELVHGDLGEAVARQGVEVGLGEGRNGAGVMLKRDPGAVPQLEQAPLVVRIPLLEVLPRQPVDLREVPLRILQGDRICRSLLQGSTTVARVPQGFDPGPNRPTTLPAT